jgi:hypothetical protein
MTPNRVHIAAFGRCPCSEAGPWRRRGHGDERRVGSRLSGPSSAPGARVTRRADLAASLHPPGGSCHNIAVSGDRPTASPTDRAFASESDFSASHGRYVGVVLVRSRRSPSRSAVEHVLLVRDEVGALVHGELVRSRPRTMAFSGQASSQKPQKMQRSRWIW